MPLVFDDEQSPAPSPASGGGRLVFDDEAPKVNKSRSAADIARDVGVTALKGAVGLPESIVGLADIPTGGRVGKSLEGAGVKFKETQNILSGMYSEQQQAANKKVQEADGFVDTTVAALQNPSTIATAIGESIPQMLGGAGIARMGIKAADKVGRKVAPWLAGAIGEGTMAAGSAAENMRQESDDGLLSGKQSVAALGSGAGTAALGAAGGKLAQKFGFGDVDTILARGGADAVAAGAAKKGFLRQMAEGGISEGVFEEMPQSIQETMWQNWANDNPLMEGTGNAAAMGMLAGMGMGIGGGGYNAAMSREVPTPATPQVQPTTATPAQPTQQSPSPAATAQTAQIVTPTAQQAPAAAPTSQQPAQQAPAAPTPTAQAAPVTPPPIQPDPMAIDALDAAELVADEDIQQPPNWTAAAQPTTMQAPSMDKPVNVVPTNHFGTPVVMGRPVSTIPSATIAQRRDEAATPEERQAIEQEMQRRGLPGATDGATDQGGQVSPLAAQGTQGASADVPGSGVDSQADASGGMAGGSGGTGIPVGADGSPVPAGPTSAPGVDFDVTGRTDEQLANLVKAGKPGWREAAIAEVARRKPATTPTTPLPDAKGANPLVTQAKPASLPVESAAQTEPWQKTRNELSPDVLLALPSSKVVGMFKGNTGKWFDRSSNAHDAKINGVRITPRGVMLDLGTDAGQTQVNTQQWHEMQVRAAVIDGETVPSEVLADYPGLAKTGEQLAPQPEPLPQTQGQAQGAEGKTVEVSTFDQRFPNIAEAEKVIKERGLKQVAVFKDGDQYRIGARGASNKTASKNLIARIKQLGGINTRYRSDVIGDKSGAPGLFSNNGKGLEDLATELKADGFDIDTDTVDGGVEILTDLIQRANMGETILNFEGQQEAAEKRANDEYRDNLKEEIEKMGGNPAKNAGTKKLVDMLEGLRDKLREKLDQDQQAKAATIDALIGKDLTESDWELLTSERGSAQFSYDQDIDAIRAYEQEMEASRATEEEYERSNREVAGKRDAGGQGENNPVVGAEPRNQESKEKGADAAGNKPESVNGASPGGKDAGAKSFDLTGETPEQVKAREEAQAAKVKAEKEAADKAEAEARKERIKKEDEARKAIVIAEREAAKKAEVDATVDDFQLGQEAPAPVSKKTTTDDLAGQGDIFAAANTPTPAQKAPDSAEAPAWHTKIPEQGIEIIDGDEKINGATNVVHRVATDAFDAVTRDQMMAMGTMYAHVLPAKDGRHGIVRLLPDDQPTPAGWKLLDGEGVKIGFLSKEQVVAKLSGWLRSAPIIGEKEAKPTPKKAKEERPAASFVDKFTGKPVELTESQIAAVKKFGDAAQKGGGTLELFTFNGRTYFAAKPKGGDTWKVAELFASGGLSGPSADNDALMGFQYDAQRQPIVSADEFKKAENDKAARDAEAKRIAEDDSAPRWHEYTGNNSTMPRSLVKWNGEWYRIGDENKLVVFGNRKADKPARMGIDLDGGRDFTPGGKINVVDGKWVPDAKTPAKQDKIEDFGEKLPPARRAMAAKLNEDLTDDAIESQPLSKIWPLKENEAIEDTFAAAVASVMRENIPAKPRAGYKLKSWVEKVKTLREMTANVLSGKVSKEKLMTELGKVGALRGLGSKIKLLEQIDRAQWGRIGDVSEAPDALRYVDGNPVRVPQAHVKIDGNNNWLQESGDINDHVDAIKALLSGDAPDVRMQFEIRRERSGNKKVFINKKGDKEYRRLMEFDTVEEARKAMKDQYDDLVAAWDGVKGRDNINERDLRTEENRPRAGKDHRKGKDISAEDFQDAFGFKGGEFGKWVSQGKNAQERQFFLNSAYDAFMDLSDILGIPPKAISLEGTLGIAFGSRGSGWASAHFEPSNLVINLTKPRGAGALAHEWFHAMDNYFARKRGGEVAFTGDNNAYRDDNFVTHKTTPMMVRKDGKGSPVTRERLAEWRKSSPASGYLTESEWIPDPNHKEGVRAEVEERFENLVNVLNQSPMLNRSKKLERSGDYWSRTLERAARSFENYIMTRMMEQGYHNDFLANVKDAESVGKSNDRYPYLLPEEIAPVAEAFDNLFNTIQTKETDKGVAMFEPAAVYTVNEDGPTYENDLFGNPLPDQNRKRDKAADRGVIRAATSISSEPGDIPGTYQVRTALVTEQDRTIGVNRVRTPEDAARALGYLSNKAVEHFDALVTDKNGKPLAIVGAFKGAISQTSVYPQTLVAEAIRIPGAAEIWMAHNHPSGTHEPSMADRNLTEQVRGVFSGTGIEVVESLVIAGPADRRVASGIMNGMSGVPVKKPDSSVKVPVVELSITEDQEGRTAINSPQAAKSVFYANSESGVMLLDAQNKMAGFYPIKNWDSLLTDGRLAELYRAMSMANASAAMIFDKTGLPADKIRNVANALARVDVRMLDVLQGMQGNVTAWSDSGRQINDGAPVFSMADGVVPEGEQLSTSQLLDIADNIFNQLGHKPPFVIKQSFAEVTGRSDDAGAASGMVKNGKVFLFQDAIASPFEAAKTIWHELLHYGIRRFLTVDDYLRQMQNLSVRDKFIQKNARAWTKGKDADKARKYAQNTPALQNRVEEYVFARGVDESLAHGFAEAIGPNGTRYANNGILPSTFRAVREWLAKLAEKIGAKEVAAWIRAKDNKEAREYVEKIFGLLRSDAKPTGDDWLFTADGAFARQGALPNVPNTTVIGDSGRNYTPEQREMFAAVGRTKDNLSTIDKIKKWAGQKWEQGIFDMFAPIRKMDEKAYALARLSKGAAGAFEAFMSYGKLSIKDGAYDADTTGGVMDKVFFPIGKESTDFLYWIAGNRAEKLAKEDRENLFTQDDIIAAKSLNQGDTDFDYTLRNGTVTRKRALIYADTLAKFNEFNKNVMDMAEQSGLIDPVSRKYWESEFYVPFYRVNEDEEFRGMDIKNGMVRQQAFKKLKGGSDGLNDLLANTLTNWAHLIDASVNNRAAKATLDAAVNVGAARLAKQGEKKTVWYMGDITRKVPEGTAYTEDGVEKIAGPDTEITYVGKKEYVVEDPNLMVALEGLSFSGLRGPMWDALGKPRHWLTIGVTASPYYKIRNLIRDSVQSIAVSNMSYNIAGNIKKGAELTKTGQALGNFGKGVVNLATLGKVKMKEKNDVTPEYVSALAGGGLIRFGTMLEGNEAARTRQLIKKGAKDEHILDSESKLRSFYDGVLEPFISSYNELGNRGEEMNRMALYDKLRKEGVDHATASFQARDIMDFSMKGSFDSIRVLAHVLPFFNSRLVGMHKLGRAAYADKARMGIVIGAASIVSLALLAAYGDDDDWKKREDWDRDMYWWFKLGDTAFRIPKPFEIGAVATLAERMAELMFNDEMTGKRFRETTTSLVFNQLAMNPTPQVVKPIIDLYANKDSFTKRPIESMGMERLDPEYRYTARTSMVARGVSTAIDGALSPVQVDHLVRGYFSWLGAFIVGGADMAVRAMSDEPTRPSLDVFKFLSGGLVANTDSSGSRYISAVYDQAKELEQAYGTYRDLIKRGKKEEAAEYREDNAERLTAMRRAASVKQGISDQNRLIRMIEASGISPDDKKTKITAIRKKQDELARRLTH